MFLLGDLVSTSYTFYDFLLLFEFIVAASISNTQPNSNNLTSITWAHAVNSQKLLKESLDDPSIDALEVDVSVGHLAGSLELQPILSHPPKITSDISLKEFLNKMQTYNDDHSFKKKKIKLDFKFIEAFESAIGNPNISNIIQNAKYSTFLNADILKGPNNDPRLLPLEPDRFLQGCKKFPNSIISIGWTTGIFANSKEAYTTEQFREMLNLLSMNEINQNVTFAVRACLIAENLEELPMLLKNPNHTLTIWTGNGDLINIDKLREVVKKAGVERTYIDLPSVYKNQLRLDKI